MDKTIATNVGEDGKFNLRLLGHNVYVRKCIIPDISDADGKLLIALCEKTKDRTNWCEIIAIGPRCGQRRNVSKAELRAKHLNRWMNTPIKKGDFVVLPESSKREMMWRGGLGDESELIVDECELIAMISAEDVGN